jgi:hypothetical protein
VQLLGSGDNVVHATNKNSLKTTKIKKYKKKLLEGGAKK